jgi:hypothetical protein
MTFSLRTLLLLFPALIVSYGLAYAWDGLGFRCVMFRWHGQRSQVRMLAEMHPPNIIISVTNANLWLQQKLPATHPHYRLYRSWLYEQQDCWGQPLVCVALNERDEPVPELDLTTRCGIYSLGNDGVSHSHGNDPDDLNSWNSTDDYYHDLSRRTLAEWRQAEALATTPWFFGAVLCCWGIHRWVQKTRF